jgi:hypothetical protein
VVGCSGAGVAVFEECGTRNKAWQNTKNKSVCGGAVR